MSDGSDGTAGDGTPSRASPARTDATASKYNQRNPAVKRILREMREMAEDASPAFHAEAVEEDIFEWHFAILGAEDSEFEGGIYHGRVLLPPEYPFKPPSFVLLTPSGRFETNTKICLSITQHHPEHWQPSWSVRTALTAVRAFMPSPAEGAVGSLDYTKEERRALAERSRREVPEFGASPERREVVRRVHAAMVRKWAETNARARDERAGESERDAAKGKRVASGSDATGDDDSIDANASSRAHAPSRVGADDVPPAAAARPEPGEAEEDAGGRPGPADARDKEAEEEKKEETASAEENGLASETPSRAPATDVAGGGGAAAETGLESELDAELRHRELDTGLDETSPRETSGVSLSPRARPLPPVDETTPSEGSGESDAASRGASSAAPLPHPSEASGPAAPVRPRRRRAEDSPEVARLKRKLDVAAAILLFAIAAILARRFLARVESGDEL